MVYKGYGMNEIIEVLRRLSKGQSRRKIALQLGLSRNTVRRYEELAYEGGWDGVEVSEEQARGILRQIKPGEKIPLKKKGDEELEKHKDILKEWLKPEFAGAGGLKLSKVRLLLLRKGVDVSYATLRRFVRENLDWKKKQLTVRVRQSEAGEECEIDFGRLGYLEDGGFGKKRLVHGLVVTLNYSRHMYVHLTLKQGIKDCIEGLESAWEFFGGVCKRVILDNFKAAVTKADRYEPILSRSLTEYSSYRDLVIDTAIVRRPRGKPRVERAIQYVQENFWKGEQFIDLNHAQREAKYWCSHIAGERIHGTTRRKPLEVFEQEEAQLLRPLLKGRFDPPTWARCKAHQDHCVRFAQALYSIPGKYIGKTLDVCGNSSIVRIYCEAELIKTHPLQPAGSQSIDSADLPPKKADYALKDRATILQNAREIGLSCGEVTEKLLYGSFHWTRFRQAQKLQRLAQKYGNKEVESACHRALCFDITDVPRIERILILNLESQSEPTHPSGAIVLDHPKFLRPASSFTHHHNNESV